MASIWQDQDEDPATYNMVSSVHDMTDQEFCEFCQMVKQACDCGQEVIEGVPAIEVYNLAVSDAEFRHRLRGADFSI